MRVLIVLAMLCLVGLAGCSDAPTTNGDDVFDDFDTPPATEGKGVLRGIVIDSTITPIPEATVRIKTEDLEVTTNENGAFQFTDLEPGNYFIDVSKVGFDKVQSFGTVEAGVSNPPVLRVQLEAKPIAVPVLVPLQYDLFMSCGFKLANIVFDAFYCDPTGALGLQGQDDSAHTFELGDDTPPSHYQSEILWDANQPLSEGLVTIQCDRDNTACGSGVGSDRICNVRGASPLICRVNNNMASADVPGGGNNFTTIRDGEGWSPVFSVGLYSNCAVQCVLGAVGVGAALDQQVSAYISLFYNYIPSDAWMFTEDGDPIG